MKLIIAQIENIQDCDYAFRDYDAEKFNIKDYNVEFCGEVQFDDSNASIESRADDASIESYADDDIIKLLDAIFVKFNTDLPRNFHGHSLSVSDVVGLGDKNYYCNSCGWQQINWQK